MKRSVSTAPVLWEVRVKSLTERKVAVRLRAHASRKRSDAGRTLSGGSSSPARAATALIPTRATSTTAASRQEGRRAMLRR